MSLLKYQRHIKLLEARGLPFTEATDASCGDIAKGITGT
jgi:hypothetical protein